LRDPEATLTQKSTGWFFMRTLATLRRAGLPMTAMTVQLYRTVLIADMVMWQLHPTIDWMGHLRRFLQDVSSDLLARSVQDELTSTYTAYRLAPMPLSLS
jgi:hypothetical protein